ncbi:MAG: xseA [Rickettsiaceae bacterium]|jgi:exodeoxyribonuclease VII large subunit|nr:xseA [Rickettsiaceae bacterium]
MVMHNIPEFTVSEFSRSVKRLVEDNFGYVRIKGEISGFKKATSGHLYFNLKDDVALVNAVCFRQMAELVKFDLSDGLEVVASGRVTTYEGRSSYQIIIEKLEIAGIGAILAAIEKRRLKLLEAGYFDAKHKKPLPFLPKIIGVITSPTGAVIEDITNRISARFPNHLLIYPATMQGKTSAVEVVEGIKYFNRAKTDKKPDIIIIARGGGSFEDLLPFNDEDLVMAVFNSAIPIISAIGHETDTTLIDYVADLRAPTPTAAAEMAVPVLKDLQILCDNFGKRLANYFANLLDAKSNSLVNLSSKLIHPAVSLGNLEQKFSQTASILKNSFNQFLNFKEQRFKMLAARISMPVGRYENWQNQIGFLDKNLQNNLKNFFANNQNKTNQLSKLLTSYDYKNVLARGYAVVRCKEKIISSRQEINSGQVIEIEVKDGNFNAAVFNEEKSLLKKKEDDKKQPSLF